MRLQKYLAMCGIASRRKSEEYIMKGQVKVNGKVIKEMGYKVDAAFDVVTLNDKTVYLEEQKVYVLLNKPIGYVTTVSEQFNRKKVTDLIDIPQRIYPVGRLDYNTSGLLILTNDGELTYRLTHPKFQVEKTYLAKIRGVPTNEELRAFKDGLKIENYITAPARINIIKSMSKTSLVKIKIKEGKNRQVRKMCEAIGHPVITLERIAIGNLKLKDLKIGEWRYLEENEVDYLKGLA